MAEKKNNFFEMAHAVCKGKAPTGMFGPPQKCARQEVVVVILPHPPPPTIEGASAFQPESSIRGTSAVVSVPANPTPKSTRVESSWPWSIQNLALALTQTISLLEEPRLLVLKAKNALRHRDQYRLDAV